MHLVARRPPKTLASGRTEHVGKEIRRQRLEIVERAHPKGGVVVVRQNVEEVCVPGQIDARRVAEAPHDDGREQDAAGDQDLRGPWRAG